ncbi:OmpA family protein [Sphingomonas sp. ZT3P38]|uniref:OmpA family protein n=1 Tax=Parasphingomonas zepuensis TaxID=3096161 RepID=UPI002FCC941D
MKTLAALVAMAGLAGGSAPETVRFITCPIYRDADSGKKSGCWLADDPASGRRFDVSQAPSKPDWNHEVLVEGRVSAAPGDPCGGVVLDPVRTSILPGACVRHMLPAEGYKGRPFVLPKRNVAPMSAVRAVPPGPYAPTTFHLFYDFDQAFLIYQYDDYLLDQAITWIRAAKPRAIIVTGYAATEPAIISGRRLAENATIARTRADRVAEALVRLGIDRRIITVRAVGKAAPVDVDTADGLAEPSRRRTDILVRP